MKKMTLILVAVFMNVAVHAQTDEKSLVKVVQTYIEKFHSYRSQIGSSEIPYNKKTSTGGLIDMAMQDFMDNATIEISTLDSRAKSRKTIKRYFLNIALLNSVKGNNLTIQSVDFVLVKTNDNGTEEENWYTYNCKTGQIKQRYTYDKYHINLGEAGVSMKLGHIRAVNTKGRP